MEICRDLNLDSVANGLADKGYAILLQLQEQRGFRQATVGNEADKQQHHGICNDLIFWIDDSTLPNSSFFFSRLSDLTSFLHQSLYLGVQERKLHFVLYPPGSFYERHLDAFKNRAGRKITVIGYLNPAWQLTDGSQLRIHWQDELGEDYPVYVEPLAERLVCFRSEILEREVLLASRDRLRIMDWLTHQLPRLN